MKGEDRSTRRDRILACGFAATVLAGRSETEGLVPLAWSLAVFFENYIGAGAGGTVKEFGPKKPVKLKAVRS